MKQQLLNLQNRAATAKNLVQKLGSKAHIAFAKSYMKHPTLTMLGLRFGVRAAALGIGILAGTLTLEGLLDHNILFGGAHATACSGDTYYESTTGHITEMDYSDGPDGVHGTSDDILQIHGPTNYPTDFRAEDGIPPATLQQYNNDFNVGDHVKIDMCTHKGGLFGAGVFSRTHYGVSMTHLEEPKSAPVDWSICLVGSALSAAVIGGLFVVVKFGERSGRKAAERRNKNRDRLEKIEDDAYGDFEEVKSK